MVKVARPLLTKIIERIPQTYCLSSGIKLELRNKRDNRKFWDIFTSSEYMSLIPQLASLKGQSISVIDCGASLGLFSLLIEHLRRVGVLPWEIEGAEFMFLEAYREELPGIEGLIIEWHCDMGDVERGELILASSELQRVKRNYDPDNHNRFTDFYLKTTHSVSQNRQKVSVDI